MQRTLVTYGAAYGFTIRSRRERKPVCSFKATENNKIDLEEASEHIIKENNKIEVDNSPKPHFDENNPLNNANNEKVQDTPPLNHKIPLTPEEKEKIKNQILLKNTELEKIKEDPPLNMEMENQDSNCVTTGPGLHSSGGKPGAGKEATECARPSSEQRCLEKMYECKIDCGDSMLDDCANNYSLNTFYDFLQCEGSCIHLTFIGCGQELDCQGECLNSYLRNCKPSVYDECKNNCDAGYQDCLN